MASYRDDDGVNHPIQNGVGNGRARQPCLIVWGTITTKGDAGAAPASPLWRLSTLPKALVEEGVYVVGEVGGPAVDVRAVHDVGHVVVHRHPRRLRHHRPVQR